MSGECDFKRGLDDRAEIRAKMRIGLGRFNRRAAYFERQHPGGVRDFLGEIHLEMPEDLAAVCAPAFDRRKLRIIHQLAALQQDFV
jgi:hypothetical protein